MIAVCMRLCVWVSVCVYVPDSSFLRQEVPKKLMHSLCMFRAVHVYVLPDEKLHAWRCDLEFEEIWNFLPIRSTRVNTDTLLSLSLCLIFIIIATWTCIFPISVQHVDQTLPITLLSLSLSLLLWHQKIRE